MNSRDAATLESAGRLVIETADPDQTAALGRRIAAILEAGDVVLLIGELGAGKTALTKSIAAGLGVEEEVSSPTFTLVNEYRAPRPVYHFDLYRLDDPAEVIEIGYDDYLNAGGVAIVEWADKAPELWPAYHLRIAIERTGETARRFTIAAAGAPVQARLARLADATSDPGREG